MPKVHHFYEDQLDTCETCNKTDLTVKLVAHHYVCDKCNKNRCMNTKKYYKVFFFDEETKTISAQGNATFEVGRVYDKNLPLEKLEMCSNTVYHFCENIENTWGHYDFAENCIFGEIEVLGHLLENTVNNFDIFASDKIKVRKILTWAEVISLTNADNKLHQFATKKLQYE